MTKCKLIEPMPQIPDVQLEMNMEQAEALFSVLGRLRYGSVLGKVYSVLAHRGIKSSYTVSRGAYANIVIEKRNTL